MPHCKFKKNYWFFPLESVPPPATNPVCFRCAVPNEVIGLQKLPHSYQRSEFLKCRGQSPNMLEPPLTLLKWFFSPKKIAISTSRCWDGLYRLHISRYWKEKLLLYYPIPEWEIWVQVYSWNMVCLYHGEKGWKKSVIIMLLWKRVSPQSLQGDNIALWDFAWDFTAWMFWEKKY